MNGQYIVYKCNVCYKHFILFAEEVTHSEEEARYITCPFNGKHHNISVVGTDESVKDCKRFMTHDSYKTKNRRVIQKGIGNHV